MEITADYADYADEEGLRWQGGYRDRQTVLDKFAGCIGAGLIIGQVDSNTYPERFTARAGAHRDDGATIFSKIYR